ncbi:MAG: cell surface protein SprA, partial [Bacteroidaceae bacterium]|nr:cell surface protein SprA [Bacteroidaceae bacterium]
VVWPQENMIDIPLSKLTEIKSRRNTLRNSNAEGVTNTTIYSEYDSETPKNRISVIGSPSLGQVKVMMIGVRNNSSSSKSAIVWVNEMRLIGFNNKSGWAAQGNLNLKLSDLGSFAAQGKMETAGFGGIEEKLAERRTDDYYRYSLTGTLDVGRLLPRAFKVSVPAYYSFTEEVTSPLYSPFDTDLDFDDVLDTYDKAGKDSLKSISEVHSVMRNFSVSNAKVNISSKTPMPYDPANLSFSFSHAATNNSSSTVSWENRRDWKASVGYNYSSPIKTIKPFEKIKSKSKWLKILKEWGVNPLPQSLALNTDMARTYHELQRRDLQSMTGDGDIPLTFSQQFNWNRSMDIKWDPTSNLRMSLNTGTNAEIEEPFLPVNKERYPTEYAAWKDSVKMSLQSFGRPLSYQQNFSTSYTLPLNKLPILEWLTADGSYSATYNWLRGNNVSGVNTGNNIANKRNVTLKATMNFEKLYNIIPYLEETNKRFASNSKKQKSSKSQKPKVKKTKPFTKEIRLESDSTVTLTHNLKNKKVDVVARTKQGETYRLKYKVIDENKILIKNRDSVSIKVTVTAKQQDGERSKFAKAMQYPTRLLMMVRNASLNYTNAYAMNLPGFMTDAGDIFGQKKVGDVYSPGLDFAFGLVDDSFLGKAQRLNWLLRSDSIASMATSTAAE